MVCVCVCVWGGGWCGLRSMWLLSPFTSANLPHTHPERLSGSHQNTQALQTTKDCVSRRFVSVYVVKVLEVASKSDFFILIPLRASTNWGWGLGDLQRSLSQAHHLVFSRKFSMAWERKWGRDAKGKQESWRRVEDSKGHTRRFWVNGNSRFEVTTSKAPAAEKSNVDITNYWHVCLSSLFF